jgi:uncharacterized protein
MSEQDNVEVVKDLYAAFVKSDIPSILAALSPEARMHHAGSPETVPWGSRTHAGPEEWGRFFSELNETLEPQGFEPEQYIAQGDRVVALGQYRFRVRATGRSFESYWAMAWTFRDGKPIEVRVFEDTEAQANAVSA